MGQVSRSRLIILIACFLATGFLVYKQGSSHVVSKPLRLNDALSDIHGWKLLNRVPLDPKIVADLRLDDYLNAVYSNGENRVFLYIGYYYSNKKVGAAHDPMVCFPGQGWVVSEKKSKSMTVGRHTLNYSTMVVTMGGLKEFVCFWYQAGKYSSPGTFFQKIYALISRWLHNNEQNAFVRLTIPIDRGTRDNVIQVGNQFLKDFYPIFLNYVSSKPS